MTTVKYEQANPVPGRNLSVSAPDVFVLHMHKAFQKEGSGWELNKDHLERLEGMASCWAEPNPFRELIRAIKSLGSIRVWVEND